MNLIILGNGFDKAHEMPCTYNDFCSYLKSSNNKDLKEFAEELEDIYSKEELWSDFEKALGKPNIETINNINGLFDLNLFGKNFEKNINNSFKKWIINLNNCEVKAKYNLSKNDMYFSFNYTSILEIQYGIDEVMHIHGFVGNALFDSDHMFVVGHGEELTNNSMELLHLTKKDTKKIISDHDEYFDSLKKINIEFIKVVGFSYSDIDINYFYKIKEILPNAKWILGYHSEKDKINAEKYKQLLMLNAEIKSTNELLVEVKKNG